MRYANSSAPWTAGRAVEPENRAWRRRSRSVPGVPTKPCAPPASRYARFVPLEDETDHARAAHRRQVEIYRAMSPQQRLQQALRMNRAMRQLLAAGFRQRHAEWSEEQIRRAVADRILHARTG